MAEITIKGYDALADLSVDQIFSSHSVHTIKPLHRHYHATVNQARADLHSLVGRKYRDLIQIAEDIDQMHKMSKSIDDSLTHLSYKSPTHVSIGNNSFEYFETRLRDQNARIARDASKTTIFNNIVNNQLLSFDLKIQGSGNISTRHLVHMAKVYFTIDQVFNQFSSAPAYKTDLCMYRHNLQLYLEDRIASWFPTSMSSEDFEKSIIPDVNYQWLESDSVDYAESLFQESPEDGSDSDDQEREGSRKYFGGSSSPFLNCMIAYIILISTHPELNTLEKVAQRVFDLRCQFLQQHVENVLQACPDKASNISFSFVIGFVESTFSCVTRYFSASKSNGIHSALSRALMWKASDFLGFSEWFEEQTIKFDVSKYSPLPADFMKSLESSENALCEYVYTVFTNIVQKAVGQSSLQRTKLTLDMFYNFISSCRKAEVLAESNAYKCVTVRCFARANLAQRLLDFVVTYVQEIFTSENKFIANDIMAEIKDTLSSMSTMPDNVQDLFEKDLISLMDRDFDEYFKRMLISPSCISNGARSDAAEHLEMWCSTQRDLSILISPSSDGILSKIDSILQKQYAHVEPFVSWGDFKPDSPTSRFLDVFQNKKESLRINVNHLLDGMSSVLDSIATGEKTRDLQFILKLLHSLKNDGSWYIDKSLEARMQSMLCAVFQNLFDALIEHSDLDSSNGWLALLNDTSSFDSASESATVPLWPHLSISTGLEKASKSILRSSYLSSTEVFDIFSCENNITGFTSVKNAWIEKYLVQAQLNSARASTRAKSPDAKNNHKAEEELPGASENDLIKSDHDIEKTIDIPQDDRKVDNASIDQDQDNDMSNSSMKLSLSQSRQLLANVTFLLCFTGRMPLELQSDQIDDVKSRVNELSETDIEDSTLELIFRGVTEFYNASKDAYLPLSMNEI